MLNTRYPMIMSEEDDRAWRKYCGFLDLSIQQFMSIQESLLLQQLERVASGSLGRKLIGKNIPKSIGEFRHMVPLTKYEDYLPELELRDESALTEKPYAWAHTSGVSGSFKRAPYTLQSYNRLLDNLMSVFILACSKSRGKSSLKEDDRVLFNVAPNPYLSGILALGASERFNLKPVMPVNIHDNIDFKEKVTEGFEISLRDGMDILVAMTSVLVKMGNDFNKLSKNRKRSKNVFHLGTAGRLAKALLRSKLEKRSILPKDLWPVKALVGWGIDTSIYREEIYQNWGIYPYEFHACTEAGIIAVQNWNKKDMTFIPQSNFFEFIPETELQRHKNDVFYDPRTVLLPEVEPGERYELVITNFYGMPFIRYRLGHLIRITELKDAEASVNLPQMVYEGRVDDLIDIAGFTRVSEKAVSQAIANAKLDYEGWTIRKENKNGKIQLHLYIELSNDHHAEDLAPVLHSELMKVDPFYRDLVSMMEFEKFKVSILSPGTFNNYYREMKENGAELKQLSPPRMNTPNNVISDLLRLQNNQVELVR